MQTSDALGAAAIQPAPTPRPRRLEPTDEELCGDLKASPVLTPGETGWRVAGKPAWLHAWVGDRATVHAVEADRSADALEG